MLYKVILNKFVTKLTGSDKNKLLSWQTVTDLDLVALGIM